MIAAAFLFGVVVGIAFLGACLAWDRQAGAPDVRRETRADRADRIDAEARRYIATRPTSSNRKAGRGSL